MSYNYKEIEKKWQNKWEKEGTFYAENNSSKKKWYGLIEFPYPSGQGLHVGHPRSYTAMDIVARKRRMQGYNVLFPIGFDAFGLPAENFAIKNHIHPKIVTEQNIANFTRQLKSIGFSFDWSRVINTTDPEYYKWTQWIFIQLYKHGLAYKATMPINFCSGCKVGLSNEEVVNGVCERCGSPVVQKEKSQWMLKITDYAQRLIDDLDDVDFLEKIKIQQRNWIGRSEGAELDFSIADSDEKLRVYTTRPDTLFGATYMVVAPEHHIIEKLKDKITNLDEIKAYQTAASLKSDFERSELNKDKTRDLLLSTIINNQKSLSLPVEYISSNSIDIDKIHDEIYCEPQNASVTKNPYKISAEKDGIDFAISIDEAKELASNKDASEIYIPLKYIKPEITIADLGEDIFGTKLGTSTTIYDSTNFNRSTNIDIACERINGTILEPGETFSFNKVVGERTAKNGFKEALIYNGGEVDYGLGGGICQISSTLYNAVLKANLEIVERKNHSMTVSYLPIGQDASVSYGSVDFKFTNSRTYPIKIVATAKAGVITVSVLGVLEKQEYVVTFETEILETTDYKTTYEYSSSVSVGKEEIKQVGKNGYKCSTYKILSLGEKEVSRTLLSTDTYKSQKEIILKHK